MYNFEVILIPKRGNNQKRERISAPDPRTAIKKSSIYKKIKDKKGARYYKDGHECRVNGYIIYAHFDRFQVNPY